MCNLPGLNEEKSEILFVLLEHVEAIDSLQFGFLFDREIVSEIRDEVKRRQWPVLACPDEPLSTAY